MVKPALVTSYRILRNREMENARRSILRSNRAHFVRLARHYNRALVQATQS